MEKIKFLLLPLYWKIRARFWSWRLPPSLNHYVKDWQKIDRRRDRSWSSKDFRFYVYNNILGKRPAKAVWLGEGYPPLEIETYAGSKHNNFKDTPVVIIKPHSYLYPWEIDDFITALRKAQKIMLTNLQSSLTRTQEIG